MVRAMLRDSRRGNHSFTDHRKWHGFCFGAIDDVNAHKLYRHHPGRAKERPNYVRTDKERVHPDCINAANPYHICTEVCRSLKHTSSSEISASSNGKSGPDLPNNLDMKMKEVASNVKEKSLVQTRSNLADILSLDSVHSSKISDASWIDESIRSTGDGRRQSKYPVTHHPEECKEEKQEEGEEEGKEGGVGCEERSNTTKSESSNISTITVAYEDRNEEEDRCVEVGEGGGGGGYIVEEINTSILQTIMNKYGDIAANCVLKSYHLRNCYLDSVCSIVRELHSTAFMVATRSRAEEISSILTDIESSEIDVSWLRQRLDDIVETMKLVSDNRAVKMAKAECDTLLDSAREDLDHRVKVVREKQEQVAAAEILLREAEDRFRKVEDESLRLNQCQDEVRFKLEKLNSSDSLLSSSSTQMWW